MGCIGADLEGWLWLWSGAVLGLFEMILKAVIGAKQRLSAGEEEGYQGWRKKAGK